MNTLFVAEVGSTHKQNISLACELARQLKQAGADIIKFQLGWPADDPVRHVTPEFAWTVKNYCDRIGLEWMASIFSLDGLNLAREIGQKRYKVAHQKVDDADLVKAILSDSKETFISVVPPQWWDIGGVERLIYTTDRYPTYPWELRAPKHYDVYYGYSDHTHGLGACLLAVARGARYIEKHVAIGKDDLWTKDTSFSVTPSEFGELVRLGREIEQVRNAAV